MGNECVQVTGAPTAANLVTFQARAVKKGVRVKWETGSEINTLGFNVWRQSAPKNGAHSGEWQKLNADMIATQNPGAVSGAAYAFTDRTAQAGQTYRYKLELVAPSGSSEWSAVVKVK
ncbi:MAG: hypothetical protein HY741_18595 [Chloroflexi bacterium]|nr:hypothetical protein [Chloroflexota bacterium]